MHCRILLCSFHCLCPLVSQVWLIQPEKSLPPPKQKPTSYYPRPEEEDAFLTRNDFLLAFIVMIRFFLLQNRQGKTRLSKWYIPPPTTTSTGSSTTLEAEKSRIEAEVHRLVTARDKKYTNFIEYNSYKLIYRRYAGLFFTIAVDVQDNELSYLETIHLFVELLDAYFANVCELDIVFYFNKVYSILDEFMLAGEMEETSKRVILDRVKFMEKME